MIDLENPKIYVCDRNRQNSVNHYNVIHDELFHVYFATLYQNFLQEYVESTDFYRFLESDLEYSGPQLLNLYNFKVLCFGLVLF